MDSDAKTGWPAVHVIDFAYRHANKKGTSESSESIEQNTNCAWCGEPASDCSGECLHKISISPVATPRKRHPDPLKIYRMLPPKSPSSSPRAYSPPPAPEVQIAGPKSPVTLGESASTIPDSEDTAKLDQGATRRIRPGTKAADMASGPPLISLNQVSQSNTIIPSLTLPNITLLIQNPA